MIARVRPGVLGGRRSIGAELGRIDDVPIHTPLDVTGY